MLATLCAALAVVEKLNSTGTVFSFRQVAPVKPASAAFLSSRIFLALSCRAKYARSPLVSVGVDGIGVVGVEDGAFFAGVVKRDVDDEIGLGSNVQCAISSSRCASRSASSTFCLRAAQTFERSMKSTLGMMCVPNFLDVALITGANVHDSLSSFSSSRSRKARKSASRSAAAKP